MNAILSNLIKTQVNSLFNNKFQEFVEFLYLICYGGDFTPIKQKRDKGCDGFLNDKRTILAIYAPEKRNIRNFRRKVGEDFRKYEDNWASLYPNWQVVYNHTFTAAELDYIETLKPGVQKVAPEHLVELVEKQTWIDKRRIAKQLAIDDQYLCNDVLETILQDLIRENSDVENSTSYSSPIYIEEKIEINYSQEDIEIAKEQYYECVLYFDMLQKLLVLFQDMNDG